MIYGASPSHLVYDAGNRDNMARTLLKHAKGSDSILTCFDCMITWWLVKICPFPKDKKRFEKNVEKWGQRRGV